MEELRDKSRDKYIYIKFIIIFCISLFMIIWTITETAKAGIGLDDDNAFLSTYHDVDENFNKIVMQNHAFEQDYNIKFVFNGNEIEGLSYEDVFLAQRVVKERKIRKDMINVGENEFNILIQDKNGQEIKNKKIEMLVTKASSHENDVKLLFNNEDTKTFKIPNDNSYNWNITGTVEVADKKGFFYIKTNAKK